MLLLINAIYLKKDILILCFNWSLWTLRCVSYKVESFTM